ncbi:uncharacterized protein LOC117118125 [Anneissia japonica]|uniref:uncharacterized protein LOC117118125 n=1 Tax=Anneissia japonica TaxID=1529436 RepID=UPI0014254B5D|nr:uncharacterized protein LOC117118125 [Anneissia japonica]
MRINNRNDETIRVDDGELEDVDNFTYLGATISKERGTDNDISRRIALAQTAFKLLDKIWNSNIYKKKTKLKIFKSNIISVLLYSAETWKITKADEQKLNIFQRRCLRKIMKIRWPMKITNEELYQITNTNELSQEIHKRRWRWIGHLLRKENGNYARHAIMWTPESRRIRGRPRTTWRRTTEKERNEFGWRSWG